MFQEKQYEKRIRINHQTLINEVRIRPELWDPENPLRYHRICWRNKWTEIADILGHPGKI